MPTTVVDPYSVLADIIKTVVLMEFSDITGLFFEHDHLHESLGSDGKTWVAVSPVAERTSNIDMYQEVLIQFYGPFNADVDPFQKVDPRIISNKAERLRRALRSVRTVGTSGVWFFDVEDTSYPRDATGNHTRFEMRVVGRGQNSALVETI